MKNKLTLFKNKWQVPFHLGSAFLPACLLLGAFGTPSMPYLACAIAAVYLVCALTCIFLPDKLRLPAGIISVLAILLTGLKVFLTFKSPALVLPPLLYGWLFLETLPVYGKDSREDLPPHVFVLGIVFHLAGQAVLFVGRQSDSSVFESIRSGLSAAFACFFLLSLLNFNRINLIYGAAMHGTVPRHIYRFNRLLTLILAALTFFIGCLPAVVRFIRKIWNTITGLIADLIAWINSLLPMEEAVQQTEAAERGDPMFAYAESEPGLFAKILEIVLYVLMGALALLAVWMAAKYIKKFAKWLWKRIQAYAASTGTGDYVDEISDTREDGDRRLTFSRRHRRRDPLRGVNERKLPPAERVRFYYLRLLMLNKDWKESKTARENLTDAAASIYERARYSEHEITEADAGDFLSLTSERK